MGALIAQQRVGVKIKYYRTTPRTYGSLRSPHPSLPQHIPSDMVFNAEDTSYSLPDDTAGRIKVSRAIRLKIIGLSAQATTLCSVGTIKDDFLGLVD